MHSRFPILLLSSSALIALAMSACVRADDAASAERVVAHVSSAPAADLDVDFASGNEHDRVSVSLADTALRVRLREGLQLHCEVGSRDELDMAPELGIDLAIRFEFQ